LVGENDEVAGSSRLTVAAEICDHILAAPNLAQSLTFRRFHPPFTLNKPPEATTETKQASRPPGTPPSAKPVLLRVLKLSTYGKPSTIYVQHMQDPGKANISFGAPLYPTP
jgi:hypothetical protein